MQVIEPNAMCLATVGEGGKPSARFVLMKGYDKRGVTWYTNYNRCDNTSLAGRQSLSFASLLQSRCSRKKDMTDLRL